MKYYFNYSAVVIEVCETICFSKVEYLACFLYLNVAVQAQLKAMLTIPQFPDKPQPAEYQSPMWISKPAERHGYISKCLALKCES